MREVVLDTNAITALFRGDESVIRVISSAECVYASVIAIGELEAGFRGESKYSTNLELLEQFLDRLTVETLLVTRDTNDCFGRIKEALRRKGTPIPSNDLWLAAQYVEHGAVMVTYDQHFEVIDGLRLW